MLGRVRKPLLVAAACAVLFVVPARAEAGDGQKALHLLAADADVVAVIDVADARDSATFATLLDAGGEALDELRAGLGGVGIDLAKDLDTIVIARDSAGLVTVLEGSFTKAQLAAVAARGEARKHRSVKYRADNDGEVALLGKRLVMTTPGLMKGVIDRHKKKGASLVKSPDGAAMRAAIALVDSRRDLWMAMRGDALGGAGGAGFDAVTFAATFEAELTIESRSKVVDADRKSLLETLTGQYLPQMLQYLEQFGLGTLASSLVVEWDDLVLELRATATNDELKTLLGLLKTM
jgi:hypothetical protein